MLWQVKREDWLPIFIIILLPLLLTLPKLMGFLLADPALYFSWAAENLTHGWLPGYPYIDPNNGFTAQSLGRLAASNWIHGVVPWWNYYSGIGLPLAAEYQPAAFFPFIFLQLLPNGMVWLHLIIQIIAGLGVYALLRQMGFGRLAAVTGGLLYAQNGTLAWLDHGPPLPLAFLPWLLFGIERSGIKASTTLPHGWRLIALSLGLMLLSGFPETAYICCIFALPWAILKFAQCHREYRWGMTWRLLLGGVVGVALSAPQILAFLEFLPQSYVGGHTGVFAHASLPSMAVLPSLFAPYIFGPIFAYSDKLNDLNGVWGGIGGYVDLILIAFAVYGLFVRRDKLSVFLLIWVLFNVAKTFGFEPIASLINVIPGITRIAFYRYATPTWEFALILLAVFGIENISRTKTFHRVPTLAFFLTLIIGLVIMSGYIKTFWPKISSVHELKVWLSISLAWVFLLIAALILLMIFVPSNLRAKSLSILLILNVTILYNLPVLSNLTRGSIDTNAISFLQKNLGLQRFYTAGPIQPNYGAYFEIASINHNYLPVSSRWVNWLRDNLDDEIDAVTYIGLYSLAHKDLQRTVEKLRTNIGNYEKLGVKYIVAPTGQNPFVETIATSVNDGVVPLVLSSGQSISGIIAGSTITKATKIDAMAVFQGNYGGTAKGSLDIQVCSNDKCATGSSDIAKSTDNSFFWINLNHPLSIDPNSSITFSILHQGGTQTPPIALWLFPTTVDQQLTGPTGRLPQQGLKLQFRTSNNPTIPDVVYSDKIMDIIQLKNPSPYFDVLNGNCSINSISREHADAVCKSPDTLIRRELFYPGWKAYINGNATKIFDNEGIFHAIELPEGHSEIKFSYAPPNVSYAWVVMWIAILSLFSSLLLPWIPGRIQKRRDAKKDKNII